MRRVARIVPVYAIWLAAYFAVKYGTSISSLPDGLELVRDKVPDWSHLLFLQNILMVKYSTFGNGWLGVSWSLAVEEQFYLLFPLVVRFVRPRFLFGALALTFPVALMLRYGYIASGKGIGAAIVLLPCRMDALAAGALVATVIHVKPDWFRASAAAKGVGVVLALAGTLLLGLHQAGLLLPGQPISYASYFIWIVLLSTGVVWMAVHPRFCAVQRMLAARPLRFFGDRSYFLYLFHRPILAITGLVMTGQHPNWATPSGVISMACATTALLFLASVSLKFVEQPIIRRAAKRFSYREAGRTGAAEVAKDPLIV